MFASHKNTKKDCLIIIVLGVVFVVCAIFAHILDRFPLDYWASSHIQNISLLGSESIYVASELMIIIAVLLGILVMFTLNGFCGTAKFGLLIVASLLLCQLKYFVGRPRPDSSIIDVIINESGNSFPSSHALFVMAIVSFVCLNLSRRFNKYIVWAIGLLFVGSVGLSRLYMGVHWASDVLGGYLAGFIIGYSGYKLYSDKPIFG